MHAARIVLVPALLVGCSPMDLSGSPTEGLGDIEGWDLTASEWQAGELPEAQLPPPGLVFDQDPLVPDNTIDFTVTGAAPGDTIHFVYSTTGTGAGPCVAQLGGLCLGVQAPVSILGTATADAAGTAVHQFFLAAGTPEIYVFTQAVVDNGQVGSVATNTITAPVLGGDLDMDGDGYCGGAVCADQQSLPGDCHDGDPAIHPAVTVPLDVPYYDGIGWSYDYNCDGVETKATTAQYSCNANGGWLGCSSSDGWYQGVPACGNTRDWAEGCIEFPFIGICGAGTYTPVTMACL